MEDSFTFSQWWTQGGIVMYPLAIYSIFGLSILIEKLFFLRKVSMEEINIARKATTEAVKGNLVPPVGDGPSSIILARIFDLYQEGISADALIRSAEREVARLEDISMRGMIWLAIIGNTAPFVGLFGTVIGIIKAFQGLSAEGLGDITSNSQLIQGIAEALVATATGLMVAVPAVICYNFLLRVIRSRMGQLELAVSDYADAISAVARKEK